MAQDSFPWEAIEKSATCLLCRKTPGILPSGDLCNTHWDEYFDPVRRHENFNFGWYRPEGVYYIRWGKV